MPRRIPSSQPGRLLPSLLAILTLLAAACSADEADPGLAESDATTTPSVTDEPADGDAATPDEAADDADDGAAVSDASVPEGAVIATRADADTVGDDALATGTAFVGPECAEGDDRTVTHQRDVLYYPIEVAEQVIDAQTIGDESVPAVTIAAIDIPGYIIDGGCVIEYDAPAGCLGAVEITAASIPSISLPSAEIPEVVIDGEVLQPASAAEGGEAAGAQADAVRQDQVCAIEEEDGGGPRTITRPALSRPTISRPSVSRSSLNRSSLNVDGQYIPPSYVAPVLAPPAILAVVAVPGGRLTAAEADQTGLEVFDDEDQTVYFAEADVLFDFGSAELQPAADEALAEIAASLTERHPEGPILIGGHTDSVGEETDNQTLSEARARTVADWLIDQGGIDADRLEVEGYGESVPIAPNETESGDDNPEGRSLNRRVVITADNS